MHHKNLQSLLHQVTTAQPDASPDVEVLTQELAAKLKSGTAQPTDGAYAYASEPTGLWRRLGSWLDRMERVRAQLGRSGQLADRPQPDFD